MYEEFIFEHNGKKIVITNSPWFELSVEALVLSANNQLKLKGATGLAKWLGNTCPNMHDELQVLKEENEEKSGRGLVPGNGIVVDEGPEGKSVIHAVTVDYDSPQSRMHSGIATVAAATEFSIFAAIKSNFQSLGFALMCTRGHAREFLPNDMAVDQLPLIQIQTIFGKLFVLEEKMYPEKIVLTTFSNDDKHKESTHFQILKAELERLFALYKHE